MLAFPPSPTLRATVVFVTALSLEGTNILRRWAPFLPGSVRQATLEGVPRPNLMGCLDPVYLHTVCNSVRECVISDLTGLRAKV
jgi:hypothetical protein